MIFQKPKKNTQSFFEKLIGISIEEKTHEVVPEKHIVVSSIQVAPPGKTFRLHNGEELRTISDLIKKLVHMTHEEWNEYANFGNNHFANWIEDVLLEPELAQNIRQAQDKDSMHAMLEDFIESR